MAENKIKEHAQAWSIGRGGGTGKAVLGTDLGLEGKGPAAARDGPEEENGRRRGP